jgi:membrane protein required for colicin V production
MNSFDLAVYTMLCVAIVLGFKAGLLRSLAAIFGYVTAMPVAVIVANQISSRLGGPIYLAPMQGWVAIFVTFLIIGVMLSALFRFAIDGMVGAEIGIADRAAGATLGVIRILLVAVLVVLVFDRTIPRDRQPPFLATSLLRPLLSAAGQQGVRTLPPEIAGYIDMLKLQRGI